MADEEYAQYRETFHEFAALPADDPRRADLRARLVEGHTPLAEHIAMRFRHRGIPAEDLRQVAMVGLVNAVDRFDPDQGKDFLAFAIPTIMGEVRRHFRDSGWAMRVPRRLQELHLSTSQAIGELSQRTGKAPTPTEIAEHLGAEVSEVRRGLEAAHAYHADSLSEPLPGNETEQVTLGDTLGDEDVQYDEVENQQLVEPLLAELPDRERRIVVLRFYGNLTQSEIANRIGISQMHVSRLLSQTLRRLRERISDDGDNPAGS